MPDGSKRAALMRGHADDGAQSVSRALEATLAAQRLYEAAAEKQKEAVQHLTDASAAFHAVRAAADDPRSELNLPAVDAKAFPERKASDSVRKVVAICVGLVGGAIGLAACGNWFPLEPGGRGMPHMGRDRDECLAVGLEALRRQQFVKAEHEFVKADDDLRVAEVFFHQGRFDESALILDGHPSDPDARFLLARIAAKRGDRGRATSLLQDAERRGSVVASCALNDDGWWEKMQ